MPPLHRLAPLLLVLVVGCGFDPFGPAAQRVDEEEETVDAGDAGDVEEPDAGEPEKPDAGEIEETDAGPVDAGPVDAGPVDAGPVDAGPVDSGPVDAGPVDAGPADAGHEPEGACDEGMILIPGGTFQMGSATGDSDEKPVHQVTLDPFCLDTFEVTVDDFARWRTPAAVAAREINLSTANQALYDSYCNGAHNDRGRHPINCVDQQDAYFYCKDKRGVRLPTEAEWEFAAAGTTGRMYPWGNDAPAPGFANLCGTECFTSSAISYFFYASAYDTDDAWPQTAPIGSVAGDVSAFGVRDMGGNVMEWVEDLYNTYPSTAQVNPVQKTGMGRGWVLRGGSWRSARGLRATSRYASISEDRPWYGFRCAANPRPD